MRPHELASPIATVPSRPILRNQPGPMVQVHPTVRPKSRLELLPVEIIQDIFLRSLEINLPQASIHLVRALSSPTIYTWLIRLLFSCTSEGLEKPFLTADFFPSQIDMSWLDGTARKNLRTLILRCRWCTLPLIRRCQREFIEHVLHSESRDLKFSEDDEKTLKIIPSWFDSRESCDIRLRPESHKPELSALIIDYQVTVWFNLGVVQLRRSGRPDRGCFELPVCEGSQLPDKLLQPPWTDAKLEFLELLSTKAYIDDNELCPRASRTLDQLIRDRDFTTFKRLLGLRVRVTYYNRPILWPVLPDQFVSALKYADKKGDQFVGLLVKDRWDDIPAKKIRLKDKLLTKAGMNWCGF